MIRVRFAPSPTGYLHVGGARTALFNYLFARHMKGSLVLRIEDTDVSRSTIESEQSLLETLHWLGLSWDEGPDVGGAYGPYRQSERLDKYRAMADELVKKEKAYEAYVYPEELESLRGKMLANKESSHYTKEIISTFDTPQRRKEYADRGLSPVIYFQMEQKDYVLHDLIKGEVVFKTGTIGDFVILRSNGIPIYNYACVIDDALMKISHVIRGDDHLSNTLRQLAMYEAFGFPLPEFAHVSMILGQDGARLSKRHGATSVEKYREMGYMPQSIVNYLSLLGWSHPDGKEVIELQEMIDAFELTRVSSNAAIYDETKLRWMNGHYIRNMDLDQLTREVIPFLKKTHTDPQAVHANYKWYREAIEAVRNRVHELSEFPERMEVFTKEPPIERDWIEELKDQDLEPAFILLSEKLDDLDGWKTEMVQQLFQSVLQQTKTKPRPFYKMLRKLITGTEDGPELVNVVHLLGRNEMIKRIKRVVEQL